MSVYIFADNLLFSMEKPPIHLCLQQADQWSDIICGQDAC